MKTKEISLILFLICFLIIFSFSGSSKAKSNKDIETFEHPDIDYNDYRYFTFMTDELSTDEVINEIFRSLVIKLLEDKNYSYVKSVQDADFIIFLLYTNWNEKLSVEVPVYDPGKKIKIPLLPGSSLIPPDSDASSHGHHAPTTYVYLPGEWETKKITEQRYYPFIAITCIGDLFNNPEIIWQGQGMKSTGKSNLKKYGQGLIEEILEEFPEISEPVIEELLPIEVEVKTSTTIEILLEQLK